MNGRRTPYTAIGIRRLKCCRCRAPAAHQWNACADGLYRPVCEACDVLINELVLRFMRIPGRDRKMRVYRAQGGAR